MLKMDNPGTVEDTYESEPLSGSSNIGTLIPDATCCPDDIYLLQKALIYLTHHLILMHVHCRDP